MDVGMEESRGEAGAGTDGAPLRRRVLVLLNPRAGRRRSLTRARRRIAAHTGLALDLIVPDPDDHDAQSDHARRAVRDGVDAVVVRGGDGMVGAGFAFVARHHPGGSAVPLGVVPAGTGNEFARAAGLARRNPRQALDAVLAALQAPQMRADDVDALWLRITSDAGATSQRWVANSVNIGFDAQVNRRADALRGSPGPPGTWSRSGSRYAGSGPWRSTSPWTTNPSDAGTRP